MTVVSAERRARRAERRRPDGSRGWFARHAWRSLVGGAERGDVIAIDALRRAWRRDPAGELWTVARRWLTPADVLAAAVENATDASAVAAIRAFCAGHGLVPDDAVDRALFFVLTGQREQYQAHDPDGSLLARGYRAADEPAREAVRRTMIGLGDLSALRVIADRPDRPLTAAEADHLTARLAEAGEWDQLWRLIPTVPIANALRAAHLIRNWRPADGPGRAFLDRLTGTAPDAIAALGPAAVTRLDFAKARRLSFAPDNSELAVAGESDATIFDLPGGSPVASYDGVYEMVAFGDATIVCRGWYAYRWSLIRCSPEQPRQVLLPDTGERTLARTPGGFVVAIRDGMWFGTAEGHLSRFVPWNTLPPVRRKTKRLVCANPTTGWVAIDGFGTLLMADADGSVLATAKSNGFGAGVYCAPGRLITVIPSSSGLHYDHTLLSWRYDGTNLVREAEAGCRMVGTLVPVPGHDLVLTHFEDRLWLDTGTLKEAGPPSAFPPLGGRLVTFSQDGSLVAAASHTEVEVHDLAVHRLAALADRSLTELGRSGLETVGTPRDHPAVAAVLGLVRAGLEYRFGADIALGPATRAAARGDDIAIGGAG
ncbi:hypothetical protein ACTMTJ_08605 [Phytohabitans sp. LJ34]|uniref:hypothetical protein n=1 Tax=Phytohabitans sp. LJ34 TaxID=3452217 RepID=UPI003F8AA0BD